MATPCGRIFEHAAADRSVSTVRHSRGTVLLLSAAYWNHLQRWRCAVHVYV